MQHQGWLVAIIHPPAFSMPMPTRVSAMQRIIQLLSQHRILPRETRHVRRSQATTPRIQGAAKVDSSPQLKNHTNAADAGERKVHQNLQ